MAWRRTWTRFPMWGLVFSAVAAWILAPWSGQLATADEPQVAGWHFEEDRPAELLAGGGVSWGQPGPRPPEFPAMGRQNQAVHFDGKGAYLAVPDSSADDRFEFTNGDALTIEAWIKLDDVRNGSPQYVIGKGRTGAPTFASDNQNWALRVVGQQGAARLSFLFATEPGAGNAHWHRWTSTFGFAADGWHHIGVSYRFGQPLSIRGWIDGQPTNGAWDLGGATQRPPVVDRDAVWIGSSQAGNPGNSLHGFLDDVAVYRERFDDRRMAARFKRVGGPRVVGPQPEVMPKLGDLAPGYVAITFSEGLPAHDRWLHVGESWPEASLRWHGSQFLLPRIPLRYDDWGIRAGWQAPVLMRMAADVDLALGKQQLLVRTRALSRLWVDGRLVATTAPITKQPPNGEEPITPLAEPPLPGLRVHGYHQQEVVGEVMISPDSGAPATSSEARRCRVVLESVVGGKNLRTESGEVVVALRTPGEPGYHVLRPGGTSNSATPLTDAAVESALAEIEMSLASLDDRSRRTAAASQDSFWHQRHAVARRWARQTPPPAPPATRAQATHPIDRFVAAKIEHALDAAASTDVKTARTFYDEVLPILQRRCFRCHGEKNKGGLDLSSRERALEGGDSGLPAVVPHQPEESELVARIRSGDPATRMPPTGAALEDSDVKRLTTWIQAGAMWPARPLAAEAVALAPVVDDAAFLRRIYLDTIGVPPTIAEVRAFHADAQAGRRERLIGRLLADDRTADHWMSFWLDLLAENPTLLNASLNSSGPFRWFLYDALRDNRPLDRMVTELILMRGSRHEGGSAGFAMAAENDAPLAAKGHIVASAFLGIELQCARCHDAPYHRSTQRDLYSLAAMLDRKAARVPKTSRVPAAFFERQTREPLIRVTLPADAAVEPQWPFAELTGIADGPDMERLVQQPEDSRERLAALITAPGNQRFARVMVNRIWRRLIGAGIVEPVHDWEGRTPSHPELLEWLAHELIRHDYDVRHVIRVITTSALYQRDARGHNLAASPALRFFNAPERRRLTAEQIVDSLHVATGARMQVEELTFVHDGRRAVSNRLTLGRPHRAWMFASLNNERDRPSLSLPRARAVADVLEAFGWTGSRQKPINYRSTEPNVLQPGVLANGILTSTLARASHDSELARLAVEAPSADALLETLFLRFLGREPSADEAAGLTEALDAGFATRVIPVAERIEPVAPAPLPLVTWFNHLQSRANTIQQEVERRVRRGPPADPRLEPAWREVYEDVVWSLINHREFVWVP